MNWGAAHETYGVRSSSNFATPSTSRASSRCASSAAVRGWFRETLPTPASELLYVKVTGRKRPGEAVDVGKVTRNQPLTPAELAERELARLVDGVAAFDDESRPYVSWDAPQFMGNFGGNYDHLARVWEWHVVGGEDEAPE